MNIGSYQSLVNFIGRNNLAAIKPLEDCIAQLGAICGCQKQRKNQKSEECNKIYVGLVNNVLPSLTDYLRNKTNDSEIVFTQNGGHEIRRIKLR